MSAWNPKPRPLYPTDTAHDAPPERPCPGCGGPGGYWRYRYPAVLVPPPPGGDGRRAIPRLCVASDLDLAYGRWRCARCATQARPGRQGA